jgi:hypothetical protein
VDLDARHQILTDKTRRDSLPLTDLIAMLQARPPHRAAGTAIFLTVDPEVAPVALMHNLKHNKVLHEKNVILTVRTADRPRVPESQRVPIEPVSDDFKKLSSSLRLHGEPEHPKALSVCRKQGLKFDIMSTSFFLGRRSVVASAPRHAAVAGQALHLPDAQRRQSDGLLPHSAGPRGRDGNAGFGLWLKFESRAPDLDLQGGVIVLGVRLTLAPLAALLHISQLRRGLATLESEGQLKS